MYRGFVLAATDPGSTPGLGPFAACHSHALILFPVKEFSCPINKKPEGQKELKSNWNDPTQVGGGGHVFNVTCISSLIHLILSPSI